MNSGQSLKTFLKSKKQRDELVARFQEADEPVLFLLSLKAGGTGLNLTAASHVIHVDRWWNPAVEDLATDRIYRLMLAQRMRHRDVVEVVDAETGEAVKHTPGLVTQLFDEELERILAPVRARKGLVLDAISGGANQAIAVAMVQWTGPLLQAQIVPWTVVKDKVRELV